MAFYPPLAPPPAVPYLVPQNFTNFQPQISEIASIMLGFITSLTTTADHNYNNEVIVRIYIPYPGATYFPRTASFQVTVTSPTSFTIPYDSTNLQPYFIQHYPLTARVANIGQVIPVAEPAITLQNAVNNDVNN